MEPIVISIYSDIIDLPDDREDTVFQAILGLLLAMAIMAIAAVGFAQPPAPPPAISYCLPVQKHYETFVPCRDLREERGA